MAAAQSWRAKLKLRWRNGWPDYLVFVLVLLAVTAGMLEYLWHMQGRYYVSSVAWSVVHQAQATDARSRVLALRDYLRTHVTFQGAQYDNRPFFRDTAAETLQSGKGYCGEVTRAFIKMAHEVGIRAQRINLYGRSPHVVAEAELSGTERVLVDCQNPPQVKDLESLEQVMLRPEINDYSTLNLRRLRLDWLFSRIKLEMGPLNYWLESPHALKASLWFTLAALLVLLRITLIGGRRLLRLFLKRRGWVHLSSQQYFDKRHRELPLQS